MMLEDGRVCGQRQYGYKQVGAAVMFVCVFSSGKSVDHVIVGGWAWN